MKKYIGLFLAIVLTGSICVSAYASTETGSVLDNRTAALENRQQRLGEIKEKIDTRRTELTSKAEEYEAFRKSLSDHRQAALQKAGDNVDLAAKINQLRLDMLNKLKALKENGTQLPAGTTAQLKEYNEQMRALADSLKGTKGQIKDVKAEYKGFVKNKDYAAMDAAFEKAAAIQDTRSGLLTQMNELLAKMNALIGD